jgi:YVTN family beta-propeller protein
VINTANDKVTATIPVGSFPVALAISPDGSLAYVCNFVDGTVSVIDTATNTVTATVSAGGPGDGAVEVTPDGTSAYVLNQNNITVLSTATNQPVATVPVAGTGGGSLVMVSSPPTSQSITQPLSPTAPNQFNFGPHNFTVQYPPGTEFSGVNMTVVAAQATQASIQQRLAGTQFANAACIVYSGAGGNCVDYQVTCSNTGGGQITCPSESSPTITVKSSFDTLQPITNPGFLTAPIGTNDWTNIFDSFFLQRIDPTMKGRTSGFSEFLAVDLGATNSQGAGALQFLAPLQFNDQRSFVMGASIPVEFHLASVANPAVPVTDATAGITVVMISDANGNATNNLVLEKPAAFTYGSGNYSYLLSTSHYAPGTYNITVYGNAFVAQQVEFTLTAATGPRISTTLQSLTLNGSTKQYVAVFKISNTGGTAAKNLAVMASNLDSTATVTSLPASLGNVNAGASVNVTLLFPETAGAPKSSGEITISESYAGGTSGGGFRVTLP